MTSAPEGFDLGNCGKEHHGSELSSHFWILTKGVRDLNRLGKEVVFVGGRWKGTLTVGRLVIVN